MSSSLTVNLSFALRPVCLPVRTTSGPSLASRPSPRRTACSTSGAVVRFQKISAPVAMPWASSPRAGNAIVHDKLSFPNVKSGDGRCLACRRIRMQIDAAYRHETVARSKRIGRRSAPASAERNIALQTASPRLFRRSARWLMPSAASAKASTERQMTHVIALVDDDRNILTSVSIALQAEGFVDPRLFGRRGGAEGADRQSARPRRVRHQDAAHGRDGAAAPAAREKPRLPVIFLTSQGRRAGRGARPRDGRRRLYRQAVLAAPADRPHPRDPAPRGARARDCRPRGEAEPRRRLIVRGRLIMDPARHRVQLGRQGRHADRHRVPDPRGARAAARRRQELATS